MSLDLPVTHQRPPSGWVLTRLVLLLGPLVALPALSADMYLPALPQLRDELAASDSMAQLTLTGMFVGLGLGQLIVGPWSDAVGRRYPVILGLIAHATTSLLCALAPTIEVLVAVRFAQGLSGAAVTVVVMASIRDRFHGIAMARLMSRIMLIMGLGPILAPSLGGLALEVTDWRGVFLALMAVGILLMVVTAFWFRETLPREARSQARISAAFAAYRDIARDPTFLALAFTAAMSSATIFAYVGTSAFLFQDGFGLSSRAYAVLIGINAVMFLVGGQLNPILISRLPLITVMRSANALGLSATVVALCLGLAEVGGVIGAAVPMGLILLSIGLIFPNTPTLALQRHGDRAGSAAALLGFVQFAAGGAVIPIVGALGATTLPPLALVMIATQAVALALMTFASRNAVIRSVGGYRIASRT